MLQYNSMVQFETENVWEHSVYGYLPEASERIYRDLCAMLRGRDAVDFALVNQCEKGDIVVTQLLLERHMAKKARMGKGKHHLKGPSKRTEEDNLRFEQSFKKLLEMRMIS